MSVLVFSTQLFIEWNPFAHIIGPPQAPHAPTLRRTFFEKIMSCFYIFFGKDILQSGSGQQIRIGIMDFLTLGLRQLLIFSFLLGLIAVNNQDNPLYKRVLGVLLCTLSAIFSFPILLINTVVSVAITAVASLFIIPVVHLIASKIAKEDVERVLAINAFHAVEQNKQPLSLLLSQRDETLDTCERYGGSLSNIYGPPFSLVCRSGGLITLHDVTNEDKAALERLVPGETIESENYKRRL